MDQPFVLHICNDFLWTKVHRNLYVHLDRLGVPQEIFTPVRKTSNKENNRIAFEVDGSCVRYSGMLPDYHRIFFKAKIRKLFKDLEQFGNLGQFDLVHATTLFSDGALAYEVFCKYRKPYIVSIRNADINVFFKYKPNLIFLARKILDHAEKLIFISQSNCDKFFQNPLIKALRRDYRAKALVINNGVDRTWLDNISPHRPMSSKEILYVGKFDRNKNVVRLIGAFLELSKRHPEFRLRLVGGSGEHEQKVRGLVARHSGKITYHGAVTSVREVLEICRQCDIFAMASHHETFGLVYVEALSQGLPILYTRNQGIDRTFAENVGVAVDPGSVADIYRGLKQLVDHYDSFDINRLSFDRFDWPGIALKYLALYESVCRRPAGAQGETAAGL